MQESFYMSNICPQNHHLNTEDWSDLEEKCRQWARKYGKVYIVCGPIYNGKRNEYIGERRVKVPDAFFKVVLINDKKMQCALGFLFDNESGKRPLKKYQVSVDNIEKLTGMDFFSALPDELENWLENEVSNTLL
jgi:endonuclease G